MHHDKPPLPETRSVFALGDKVVTVGDVIQAAHFRGDLDGAWQNLLRLRAIERRASMLSLEPEVGALQSLSDDFRSERNLISAQETEQWLADRGLTLTDFNGYFVRKYWNVSRCEPTELEVIAYLDALPEIRDLLRVEMMMGGEFERIASEFCRRVIALHAVGDKPTLNTGRVEQERARFCARTGLDEETLPRWLFRCGVTEEWFGTMLVLEAAYRWQCYQALTPERRQRRLRDLRLPLTQIEVEWIEFPSWDMALEGFHRVRGKEGAMTELAEECGYAHQCCRFSLEDFSEAWQIRFLCAVPGDVLVPGEDENAFPLYRLIRKSEPSFEEPEIQRRVDQQILERHFSELAVEPIQWLLG